jgi:D-beta-D-heptose 7-phosphate kinase / D-beta-D-heptose 1-phosphate adenosyltransferase
MNAPLIETVKNFSQSDRWILVIGDLMLDRYLIGDVQRISPEAPVPVVLLKNQIDRAGGAANVAANLAGLGIQTHLAGCVGEDTEGEILIGLVNRLGISTDAVIRSETRATTAKTRVMSSHQQIVRVDQEVTSTLTYEDCTQLRLRIDEALKNSPSAVILSDYAKGVLTPDVCQSVIMQCQQLSIPVIADPKGLDYQKYQGATALTPNKKEAAEACQVDINDTDSLLKKVEQLKNQLKLSFIAVTRGDEGISLIENNRQSHIPATARQVFDVSGAGDTVIATLAAGLSSKLSPIDALQLANCAAGIVVGKVGTVPIALDELIHELMTKDASEQADKISGMEVLLAKVAGWRSQGKKIVFTNGCFDLLHAGHVTYLEAAKKTGDCLILGLNTDRSVSALKGPSRPVVHEKDRARVLAALESVDAVILFDEDTPLNLINAIKPDVIVKGDDYSEEQVVGGKEVKSWGGEVKLIPLVQGRSTSNLIEKMTQ